MKTVSLKELKSFTFVIIFYLIIGSLLVYLGLPGYVLGFVLAAWTLAVLSFNIRNTRLAIVDSSRLLLGLTPPYLIFNGLPFFTQIFKYYFFTISTVLAFAILYWMIKVKDDLTNHPEKFLDY